MKRRTRGRICSPNVREGPSQIGAHRPHQNSIFGVALHDVVRVPGLDGFRPGVEGRLENRVMDGTRAKRGIKKGWKRKEKEGKIQRNLDFVLKL